MKPKLEVCGISYSYHSSDGETLALSDIRFSVAPGEFIAIVGPSGCGKSTLLSILAGLLKPEYGEMKIDGELLNGTDSRIGYMLQQDQLFEWRSIYDNAVLGLEIQKKLTKDSEAKVMDMLHIYGLGNFIKSKPHELSGGMRQRTALIRTLALDPDLLLLDEPFSALDYQTRLSVCDDISSIIRERGKTAILVTHDLSEAISVADRIIILSKRPGQIRSILTTSFSNKFNGSLARRNAPEFQIYFNELWEELQNEK